MRLHELMEQADDDMVVQRLQRRAHELGGGYPVVYRPETDEVFVLAPTDDEEDALFFASYSEFGDPDRAAEQAGVLHVKLVEP